MPEPLKPDEVDELTRSLGSGGEAGPTPSPAEGPASLEPLDPAVAGAEDARGMELLDDVDVKVKVELGRARVVIRDVLKLAPGAVVPLDTLTGDPLDVYVNDRLIARGEVLVVNDKFALRITEVVATPSS